MRSRRPLRATGLAAGSGAHRSVPRRRVSDGNSPKHCLYARENSPKCQKPHLSASTETCVDPCSAARRAARTRCSRSRIRYATGDRPITSLKADSSVRSLTPAAWHKSVTCTGSARRRSACSSATLTIRVWPRRVLSLPTGSMESAERIAESSSSNSSTWAASRSGRPSSNSVGSLDALAVSRLPHLNSARARVGSVRRTSTRLGLQFSKSR